MEKINTIIWDIGNVLIYWDPRHAYRDDPRFSLHDLDDWSNRVIKNPWYDGDIGWNAELDKGRNFAEIHPERVAMFPKIFPDLAQRFPDYADLMKRYFDRFEITAKDPVPGTDTIRTQLRKQGYRTLALSNFSAETWPRMTPYHQFMTDFEEAVISGYIGMIKPAKEIFEYMIDKCRLVPGQCVFIDDSGPNITAARALGFNAIQFKPNVDDPDFAIIELKQNLAVFGVTPAP